MRLNTRQPTQTVPGLQETANFNPIYDKKRPTFA